MAKIPKETLFLRVIKKPYCFYNWIGKSSNQKYQVVLQQFLCKASCYRVRRKWWRKRQTEERKWTVRKTQKIIKRNYLKTINGRGGNKCRALPSAEMWDGALEASVSSDPIPHPQAFTGSPSSSWCPWHKARTGASDACFEGRSRCRHTPGDMRITRQAQPRGSSFLSILHTER